MLLHFTIKVTGYYKGFEASSIQHIVHKARDSSCHGYYHPLLSGNYCHYPKVWGTYLKFKKTYTQFRVLTVNWVKESTTVWFVSMSLWRCTWLTILGSAAEKKKSIPFCCSFSSSTDSLYSQCSQNNKTKPIFLASVFKLFFPPRPTNRVKIKPRSSTC